MNIYNFYSYRDYLKARIDMLPAGGRGELLRIAKAVGIHSSILSQVFQGHRELTSEQAVAVADYLELNENETRYFLLLAQWERAGSEKLKRVLKREIDQIRRDEAQVVRRIPQSQSLSPEQKAVFYSNWYYSAVRVLSSIPEWKNAEGMRKRLGLTREQFTTIERFLVEHGLCEEQNGILSLGPQSTHIEGTSPLVSRHHGNWRVKAMERHPSLNHDRELAFTSPMSLSRSDVPKVREAALEFISKACEICDPSPSEVSYCLNLDWFEF
jgi:uncharacterized protein (TIGR02147 family)